MRILLSSFAYQSLCNLVYKGTGRSLRAHVSHQKDGKHYGGAVDEHVYGDL